VRDSLGPAAAASIDEHELALANESNCVFVGGLGGCGMSRVIAARQHFAACCGVGERLRIVAPTGAAAALLGGSTLHSFSARKVGCQTTMRTTASRLLKAVLEVLWMLVIDGGVDGAAVDAGRRCWPRSTSDAGGVAVVATGDCLQLKPIAN
jgi:hypothetical protein